MTSGSPNADGREDDTTKSTGSADNSATDSTGTDSAAIDANAAGTTPPAATGPGATSPNATVPSAQAGSLVFETSRPWALVGRFDLSNPNAPRFSLPNSKIGIRFTGTSLGVYFADTGYDSFAVTIDGVPYAATSNSFSDTPGTTAPCAPFAQVPLVDGNNWPGCLLLVRSANLATPSLYPVAANLPPGEHVAWLTKRSEFLQGSVGTTQFFGVELDQGASLLAPPPYRQRRIEVVGDSSTSGYGAAQRNPCGFTNRNGDGDLALAGQLGNFLHAEVVNISSSGQGVYRSYYDADVSHNLPVLYRARLPLESVAYDFSQDHVDAIVLSAGGDDLWGASGSGAFNNRDGATDQSSARANFVAAYTTWLAEIRAHRPDALIVCMLSYAAYKTDVTLLGGAIQEAVATRYKAGDANVVYFTFYPSNDPVTNPKGYQTWGDVRAGEKLFDGCTGHPSPAEARYLAKAVGPTIASRMGWTDIGFAP